MCTILFIWSSRWHCRYSSNHIKSPELNTSQLALVTNPLVCTNRFTDTRHRPNRRNPPGNAYCARDKIWHLPSHSWKVCFSPKLVFRLICSISSFDWWITAKFWRLCNFGWTDTSQNYYSPLIVRISMVQVLYLQIYDQLLVREQVQQQW